MRARSWILLPLILLGTAMSTQDAEPADVGIRIDAVTPKADDSVVTFSVQVSDLSTGKFLTDADVEVTYRKKDGTESKGQPLEGGDDDGLYHGDVTFPSGGQWTVHITADGAGNVELTPTVADSAKPRDDTAPSSSSSDDDGSTTTVVLVVVGAAVVVALVVGLLVSRRKRSSDGDPVDPTPGGPTGEPTDDSVG